MLVDILHNNTEEDGRMAIFSRFGTGPATRAGDTLTVVGSLTLTEATDASSAAELSFVAGNAPHDTPAVLEYRSWRVRSLSVGDVVRVHTPEGPVAVVCESTGWAPIDLAEYTIQEKVATKADIDRARLDEALALIKATYPNAAQVLLETSDQSRYGFRLMDVLLPDGASVPYDTDALRWEYDHLHDLVGDLVGDLDWDGVVGESPQGYATIAL